MKIALFGGTGFLGAHTVAALGAAGHDVVVLARGDRLPTGAVARAEHRRCDATEVIDPATLAGCDAIVNLIGIKQERGGNTFERAHVGAVHNIIDAARLAGIRRLVHIGVSASRPAVDPYLDTKYRGELAVVHSGLDYTVLRPGVVYGSGDDLVHHLVAALRHAPVFPIPGAGRAPLAVIDVADVAQAVVECLTRPESIGHSLDLVSDDRLDVRGMVAQCAGALALPSYRVSVPLAPMRVVASAMERWLRDPPVTRAQLNLLANGIEGDPAPARERLDIHPRRLTDERIRELAQEPRNLDPLFGISLRAIWSDAQRALLRQTAALPAAGWRIVLGIGVLSGGVLALDHDWFGIAAGYLVLFSIFAGSLRLPWRALWRIDGPTVLAGVLGAAALYVAGALVFAGLVRFAPVIAAQASELQGRAHELEPILAVPLLLAIVLAEEIYWRIGIGFALAHRWGAWPGIGLGGVAFALAHLGLGSWLLCLAAVACGWFWTWLAIRTRSLTAPFLAHALWDLAVLWGWPYTAAAHS